MAIPTAFALAGRPPRFLHDLGFLSGPAGTPEAWLLAIAAAVAFVAYSARIPVVRKHLFRLSWLKLLSLLVAVAAATVEEAFFRRWIMDRLQNLGSGPLVQVVGSALAFGIPHAWFGLLKLNWRMARGAMVATSLMGLALAVVYLAGGRSLAPCIAAHFLITFALEPGLMLAAATGRAAPQREASAASSGQSG